MRQVQRANEGHRHAWESRHDVHPSTSGVLSLRAPVHDIRDDAQSGVDRSEVVEAPESRGRLGIGALMRWINETYCGLAGHDLLFDFEPGKRIYLRCANCGHQTPGWLAK